jgi:hypothetical protein
MISPWVASRAPHGDAEPDRFRIVARGSGDGFGAPARPVT